MEKQTAVEWLVKMLYSLVCVGFIQGRRQIPHDIINQAKELEKQQIVDAYRVGKVEASLPPEKLNTGGKYYRELFKPE
jgi:hypothetical protein